MPPILILTLVALPVVLVSLVSLWIRRLIAGLRQAINESGETIVIEPQRGLYQLSPGGIVSVKTEGAVALTDRRIVFRKPIGGDTEIFLSQITEVSKNKWFKGNYRGGHDFLILKLRDESEVAFMVREPDRWLGEILSRQAGSDR